MLFNFDVTYEDPSQISNAQGLLKEKKISELVLDQIAEAPGQVMETSAIKDILKFTSLGWTKGYRAGVKLTVPEMANYQDFVYMATLLKAKKIAAMPSSYEPVTYLRRAQSITGKRNAKSFSDVLKQLQKFASSVPTREKKAYKDQVEGFIQRKVEQYRETMMNLISSIDYPDITQNTLESYNQEASKIIASIQ